MGIHHKITEKKCLLSVLRRKTLNRMQTNEYEEIEYYYQKGIFLMFLSFLPSKKMRKWMESTLYWDTKGHNEICV